MASDLNYYFLTMPYSDSASSQPRGQFQFVANEVHLPADSLYMIELPALKIGTLDTLMEASDELTRLDSHLESITAKLLHLLEDTSGKPRTEIARVHMGQTCDQYLASFKWDDRRYDVRDSLKATIDRITQEIQSIDDKVRLRYLEYSETRKKLNQAQRKESGNLAIRPLAEVIREFNKKTYGEEASLETDYLITLYVVLPTSAVQEWMQSYASLGGIEFIVPDSSRVIAQDAELTLVNVVLFRKFQEDFKKECRSRKWILRDAVWSEASGHESDELNGQHQEQRTQLLQMLTVNFGESFQGYIHIKVIRTFVESILRYGLPPRFVTMCARVNDRQERSLRLKLRALCAKVLDTTSMDDAPDTGSLQLEYPYVSLRLMNVHRTK